MPMSRPVAAGVVAPPRVKLMLWATIALFAVAAAYISYLIVERQQALRDTAYYNIAWVASQAGNEVLRLELPLAAYASGKATAEEVQLRFEIVESRLALLQDGRIGPMTDGNPEAKGVVDDLAAAIHEVDGLIAGLDRPGTVDRILAILAPFESR